MKVSLVPPAAKMLATAIIKGASLEYGASELICDATSKSGDL